LPFAARAGVACAGYSSCEKWLDIVGLMTPIQNSSPYGLGTCNITYNQTLKYGSTRDCNDGGQGQNSWTFYNDLSIVAPHGTVSVSGTSSGGNFSDGGCNY
jgi:hypothetical protein